MNERPLPAGALLRDAVRAIEQSARRIAVVVHADGRVAGTLTDGDVRRCLLAGGTLDTPLAAAMNARPVTAPEGSADGYILDLLKRWNIMALPLVDARGAFVRLVHLRDLAAGDEAPAGPSGFDTAVIMAGGEGKRLRPITSDIPKPMVEVGGIPLIERQVRTLAAAGVTQVYVAVNYLSHVIEDHFGDGRRFGLSISYLRERTKLGTAGALSLLPQRPGQPFLLINGDVLTTSDFGSLHHYHVEHGATVTVSAVQYVVDVPYGVIRAEGAYVAALEEKPSQKFLCNAGIYALSPEALDLVPPARPFDMTELITECLARRKAVAVFPVHEYWTDIGTPADLEKAQRLFRYKGEGA
jgi:dTDP-glucose pyrophosphorylase